MTPKHRTKEKRINAPRRGCERPCNECKKIHRGRSKDEYRLLTETGLARPHRRHDIERTPFNQKNPLTQLEYKSNASIHVRDRWITWSIQLYFNRLKIIEGIV